MLPKKILLPLQKDLRSRQEQRRNLRLQIFVRFLRKSTVNDGDQANKIPKMDNQLLSIEAKVS